MNLHVKDISKSFNGREVLKNISFTVEKGEFISIVGPSGSGKSTLFHIIGGILSPDHGQIVLNGKDITNQSGFISYMPQSPSLFPWRTVLENALLGQELAGKVDIERAKKLLIKAGLEKVIDAYPHTLSGGMKQRVAFIRALLSPQSMMCLDEPFSALDAFTRLDMQKWLLNIWETYEKSILFITHDIEEALFLSDKIIILSSNPAEIKKIVSVPFSRPRKEDLLLSYSFVDLKKEITKLINKNYMEV